MPPVRKVEAVELAAPESRKRAHEEEEDEVEQSGKRSKLDHFLFLELSGELRNRIYRYASEMTYRTFPTSTFNREHQRRMLSCRVSKKNLNPYDIPYLGLVQSCAQIRREFRPWWLEAHQIPLCNSLRYLHTFYLRRLKSDTAYYSSKGELRIFVRKSELDQRDLQPLVKHLLLFPNRKVTFNAVAVEALKIEGLNLLLENQNPQWIRWIRGNIITQIRLSGENKINVVVKEKCSAPWMKMMLEGERHMPDDFLHSLGLSRIGATGWQFGFSVDYR